MLRLSNEVDRIIAQIPVPDKVKELIPNIYLSVFRLFILKQKKTPIEVMSNELNNSFLHTYIAPLIQKEMGLERSKQDVLEYVSKLVEKDCKITKNKYTTIWNTFENMVRKFNKVKEFGRTMFNIMKIQNTQQKKEATIKIKFLALLALVRFYHPEGQEKLPRIQEVFEFIFKKSFPTLRKIQICRKEVDYVIEQKEKNLPLQVLNEKLTILGEYGIELSEDYASQIGIDDLTLAEATEDQVQNGLGLKKKKNPFQQMLQYTEKKVEKKICKNEQWFSKPEDKTAQDGSHQKSNQENESDDVKLIAQDNQNGEVAPSTTVMNRDESSIMQMVKYVTQTNKVGEIEKPNISEPQKKMPPPVSESDMDMNHPPGMFFAKGNHNADDIYQQNSIKYPDSINQTENQYILKTTSTQATSNFHSDLVNSYKTIANVVVGSQTQLPKTLDCCNTGDQEELPLYQESICWKPISQTNVQAKLQGVQMSISPGYPSSYGSPVYTQQVPVPHQEIFMPKPKPMYPFFQASFPASSGRYAYQDAATEEQENWKSFTMIHGHGIMTQIKHFNY